MHLAPLSNRHRVGQQWADPRQEEPGRQQALGCEPELQPYKEIWREIRVDRQATRTGDQNELRPQQEMSVDLKGT